MERQKQDIYPDAAHSTKIPYKISEYIKNNFRDSFLTQISNVKNPKGEEFYFVDISHDNTLYHLKFNINGVLIQNVSEPLLELNNEDDSMIDEYE